MGDRQKGLFPPHIIQNLKCVYGFFEEKTPYTNKVDRTIQGFKRKILCLEIKHIYWSMNETKKNLEDLREEIIIHTAGVDHERFLNEQDDFIKKQTRKKKATREKKLRNLSEKYRLKRFHEGWVENLTDVEIPENVENYLGHVKKFAHNPGVTKEPVFQLIADVEGILGESSQAMDKEIFDITRNRISNTIQNYVVRNDNNIDANDRKIRQQFKETKLFLSQPEIAGKLYITESDKGKKTVILNADDYETAMQETLDDRSRFMHLRKDPTNDTQKKVDALLGKLVKKGFLEENQANKLKIRYPKPPRIYGLPKTHKNLYDDEGKLKLKLRTITSFIESPLYMVSKYVADILGKVNGDSIYDLRNSYDCAEKLASIKIPPNYRLISLDVTALFDSITPRMASKAVSEEWDKIKDHTTIPKSLFIEMVELCLENNYCQYRGKFYKVLVGVPMGASSSVPISSIIMNLLLRNVLGKLPFEVPFCFRFVDDLLLAIPADQIDTTLRTFNDYNPRLSFTVEVEKDGVLPFLDMEVHRDDEGNLSTKWYSKPCASNRFINCHSNHSFTIKLNCAQGLINRVHRLTTKTNKNGRKPNALKSCEKTVTLLILSAG
jgi:hypothetical protein